MSTIKDKTTTPARERVPLDALREPFPTKAIGKLPKLVCRACMDDRGKACGQHKKTKCVDCGNWMSPAHIHIDYVGHSVVTDRLLEVDPCYTWEPVAWEQDGPRKGLPLFVRDGNHVACGLWIRLTILGQTRLGYGSVDDASEPEKELVSNALRNAAMRFGVALDVWSKDELESSIRREEEERENSLADAREHAKKANVAPTKAQRAQALKPAELEEAHDVFGAPAGERQAIQVRLLEGLPIYRTWDSLKDEKIGKRAAASCGGVPSAKLVEFKTWQWASEGSQDGEREQWLRKLIERAKELYAKNKSEPLPIELQAATLAHSAMLNRIARPPAGDEATCPVNEEEV